MTWLQGATRDDFQDQLQTPTPPLVCLDPSFIPAMGALPVTPLAVIMNIIIISLHLFENYLRQDFPMSQQIFNTVFITLTFVYLPSVLFS